MNSTVALLAEEPTVQQFRLYSDGWGVPQLREQGAASAGLETMINGMKNRHSL